MTDRNPRHLATALGILPPVLGILLGIAFTIATFYIAIGHHHSH